MVSRAALRGAPLDCLGGRLRCCGFFLRPRLTGLMGVDSASTRNRFTAPAEPDDRLIVIWHAICHTAGMRTTLDIDDDLLAALLARYPGHSKTEAIEAALRAYLAEDAVSRLRRLAGSLEIEDVSAASRAHDRRS